ncbi:splicing factor U2af large subunit B [Trifolium repens]|nr:splicing factor U2af large subunit B [Trifolium repens]
MSRLDRLKEKDRKSNLLSVDNYDEDSAARTRPFSFEEIMLRRRNKELLENVKDPAKEAWNISPEGSLEKTADHFESPSKHHKIPSFSMEKHASEELVNVSSRKKIKSTIVKEDDLTEGRDRANNILETKSSAGLNNKGWMTEEKNGKERRGSRKIEQMSKNSENKHSRDSVNKGSYEEKDRSKSAGKLKKVNHIEDEENRNEYYTERKHGKDRHDGGKIKKWLSNDFEEVPEKKHHRDSDKHIHAEGRAKYEREINKETRATHEREIKRKYRNVDDEIQDRNATRKQDIAKHHNPHIHERKNRQEKVKSHYEESTMKRRRSRSREHEDRRRSPSFSPRAHRNTYKDGERKDLSMLSLADSSRKKHPDDKNRVSTNGSSRRSRSWEREDRRRSPSFSPRAHKKTSQDGERKDLSMLSLSDSSRKKHSDDKNKVSTNGSSRRSRSREREDRRRSPSFSPRAHRKVYQDGERKDLSMLLTDSSRKKHSDDKNRVSTNGSSSHHRGYRHSDSASGLGGYSPRKRKSETDNKTPSPSKHSSEKKRAGWDLPPVGTDPSPAVVSSGFQLSNNHSVLSSMHDVTSATSLDLSIVKPLPVSFLNAVSTGKNVSIDSVQLTQATRPMRRLYIENLPASASEKVVMDCFNNFLLSASVNLVQQTRPCISCIVHKDRGQALVEFLTAEDASAALSLDGSTLFGSMVKIRRPKDYVEFATGEPERSVEVAVTISDVVVNSPNKIFIGGISNHVSSDMLLEIVGVFGSLKAYHFEAKVSNGSCAFVEYVDHSVTIKACAGLNGMKLGGEVLTVVLAMPDAPPPMENDGKPPSYDIPEHAKSLLSEPTEVLEIKNVFTVESISSLSDMGIEDILEDVRLECARFGTVKSIQLARHSEDKIVITKSKEVEKKVGSEEASLDTHTVTNNNAEYSSSEEATCSNSMGTSGMELHCDKDLEEDKDNNGTSVNVDKNAEIFYNTACQEQEHLVTDASVKDAGNEGMPSSTIQQSPDHQDTSNDAPELHDNIVDNDIDKRLGDNMDSKNTVCPFRESFYGCDRSSELVGPRKGIEDDDQDEDHTYNHVFEPGSVLVEYARTEACRSAAHCLHRRFFDGRMVTVQYIPLNLYRARFTK